jgi:hypothetical protein
LSWLTGMSDRRGGAQFGGGRAADNGVGKIR